MGQCSALGSQQGGPGEADPPGVADGAGLPLETIIALNIRTEIAYGLQAGQTDGCTSVSYHADGVGLLAQNWDWRGGQAPNLIHLTIRPGGPDESVGGARNGAANGATNGAANGAPNGTASGTTAADRALSIITEGGIIGKIGISAAGVGVGLNAIPGLGVAYDRLPVHLALRAVLDWSAEEAARGPGVVERVAARLEAVGVASAAHIFLADAYASIGLEVSAVDTVRIPAEALRGGRVVAHSNHYVAAHPGVKSGKPYPDSPGRLARMTALVAAGHGPVGAGEAYEWLKDREGWPSSICRGPGSSSGSETLFSIVMDLEQRTASVEEGRPGEGGARHILRP